MDDWRVFVLAMLKVGLNCDFDRLTHIANHDQLVRQMLQHDAFGFDGASTYTQQTYSSAYQNRGFLAGTNYGGPNIGCLLLYFEG